MKLVLSRRRHETVVIDGRIRVRVEDVHGQRVRLSIDAPPEITVNREEVEVRKRRDAAGQPQGGA